jgi:class 3 adenylate cyclase
VCNFLLAFEAGARVRRATLAGPDIRGTPGLGMDHAGVTMTPGRAAFMSETRKLAAILAADIVGFSRLAGADEDRILARLRSLRSDLIDPTISVHHGHVVKRMGDGIRSNSAAWSMRYSALSSCRIA